LNSPDFQDVADLSDILFEIMDSGIRSATVNQKRAHDALLGSLKLSISGQHEDALRLMDDVITEAIREREDSWVFLFINHAAILNQSGFPDRSLLKHYYEQYLTNSPDHPRALYGLADVAMKDGQTETAKQYAKRCHEAILQSDDAKVKKDLLDLVLERWPELAG
jgi:hypothetical protein